MSESWGQSGGSEEHYRRHAHTVFDKQWVYWMVNSYLKHSESQWVSQLVFVDDEGVSTTALHIDTGEGVKLRVHPVEPLVQQVCAGSRGRGSTGHTRLTTGIFFQKDLKPENHEYWSSPSVMPLGQTMLSVTRAMRSPPLRPPFSILAGFPQSVQ